MSYSFKYLFLILMILLSIRATAQNAITLKQAINNGLSNRKNIAAGKLDIDIRKLQTQTLYRKYLPQISAEYTYLYNPILQTSILPIGIFNPTFPPDATKSVQFGTKWSQSIGLTVYQPLLDVSIKRNINTAKLQERIIIASQAQSEYEIAASVAQTYIDVILQKAKIKTAIADTNRTFISYKLLKNKFDEKRLLKSDLNKSLINHNNALQQYADAVSLLIENKVYLLFLMGEKNIEKADFEIDTNFIKDYSPNYFIKDLQTNISTTNTPTDQIPELQQLTLQSELAILQTKSEKAKYMPTIGIKGFIGANQFTNTFDPLAANSWFGLSYVGLNAKLPLLFGENKRNKLQEFRLQSDQYILQKEDKNAQYAKDALASKLKIENIQSKLKTQEKNLVLSLESMLIIQARVQEGQETASTLNLDEANLQSLQAEYETNKKQLWTYWLNYLKATGQLSTLWK